ncbi:hypothetical protein DFH29DRAFT_812545 [Suillus ampliporus]|nr:hypothetical protein DFH29DRAFT_812545 [Suillus ampliporus]
MLQAELSPGSPLTFSSLFRFMTLASTLRNNILLVQAASHPSNTAPDFISPAINLFLAACCDLSESDVDVYWKVLKDVMWHSDGDIFGIKDMFPLFANHGRQYGITPRALYPPHQTCLTEGCPAHAKASVLKKAEQRQIVLYTLDRGPIATYSIHLYCAGCNTNYHHGYSIKDKTRTFYPGIPDVIQVGGHQFVETRVVRMWRTLMLVSWTSMSNCARLYNVALMQNAKPPPDFPWNFELTGDHVWHGFVQFALMEDCVEHHTILSVPQDSDQRAHFMDAISKRNNHIRTYGQDELRHYCNKCTRFRRDDSGMLTSKYSVVVTDGVTVGHPCCAIHNCHAPLNNNRDHFCPAHTATHAHKCAIIACSNDALAKSKVCHLAEHKAVERTYQLRGQSRFQLQQCLQRSQLSHPTDSTPQDVPLDDLVDDAPLEEDYTLNIDADGHQLVVAPCGMILARETFYGAEGVGSVIEMIKHVFRSDDIKPQHIFYDNNCTLSKMVKNDPYFQNIGLSVDVFHFNCKHAVTDRWCQENCNPAAFEDLLADDSVGWYFNSSIAEQTNVWFGGYHTICREMIVHRYRFFLDEMVMQKNRLTKAKLEKEGRRPGNWPLA